MRRSWDIQNMYTRSHADHLLFQGFLVLILHPSQRRRLARYFPATQAYGAFFSLSSSFFWLSLAVSSCNVLISCFASLLSPRSALTCKVC